MTSPISDTFANDILVAAHHALIAKIRSGDWLTLPSWQERVNVDGRFLRGIYDSLDRERIKALVKDKVEERIADAIYNAMATEVANDTKQILCNKELREEMRGYIRDHMRGVAGKVQS